MSKIETMIKWAVDIANDNSHGYDQIERWGVDYDCSSLVISACKKAGYNVGGATYTGNMQSNLVKYAKFTKVTNIADRKRGDILLNVKHHTAIYLGDGQIVQASINEKGTISGGKKGDQTGREIAVRSYYDYPWDMILRPPTEGATTAPSQSNYIEMKNTAAITTASVLNIRSGQGTNYSIVGTLPRNSIVEVRGVFGDWVQIKNGFIHKSYTKMYEGNVKTVAVNTYLNVRAGAGTSFGILGKLYNGNKVIVQSVSNNWAKIIYNNSIAYVSNNYLK